MSLARMAIRVLTVAALTGTDGARPTLAGARVYDSRIGDVDLHADGDRAPLIVVTTGSDQVESAARFGPPFLGEMEIEIELGVCARAGQGDAFEVGYPETDAEIEATIDLMQHQIIARLTSDPHPLTALWARFVKIRAIETHRQADDQTGVKLGVRLVRLSCAVGEPCASATQGATGLGRLPEPARTIALALPQDSPARANFETLAAALQASAAYPLFESLGMTIPAGVAAEVVMPRGEG
jgi:hypothetical protein